MSRRKIKINCDLCGSSEKRQVTTENDYPISRCLNCGFVYVNEIPEVENGKVLGEYYTDDRAEIEVVRKRYEAVSVFLIKEIAKHKAAGTLLDVGCGYGFFLLKARENGWEVFGTDLSEAAIDYAKTCQGLQNVHCSDLSEDVFDGRKFDSINLTNVLEHVPSPTGTLNDCRRLLDDKGVLTIRVPNMEFHDIKRRLTGVLRFLRLGPAANMNYLASPPPVHLSGFSSRTLRKFFDKANLKTIEIKPSKLSSAAQENIVYQLFEFFAAFLYKISFRKINLSPTILAIAAREGIRRRKPAR